MLKDETKKNLGHHFTNTLNKYVRMRERMSELGKDLKEIKKILKKEFGVDTQYNDEEL